MLASLYLWIKAFHLIAVIFWVAGLLLMPRFFAYHRGSEVGGELEAKMLEAEEKLQKIILNPAMIVAFILGLILIGYNFPPRPWLLGKLLIVFGLMGFHGYLSKTRKEFAAGYRPKSEKFYRQINEIPSFAVILIVLLVILKPFA